MQVKQSRKQFIKSCIYTVLSAAGAAFLLPVAACRREEDSAAVTGTSSSVVERTAQINPDFEPAYLKLHQTGELKKRGEALWNVMKSCRLCPRECGINRLEGNEGFCKASSQLEISSYHAHFGEEKPLVGRGGSGTVFFSNCALRCVFCINWEISQGGMGSPKEIDDLAKMMLSLQNMGCHNINLVTPSHYSPHILLAVDKAAARGLRLPLVYNTCGWERLEILKMLAGIVDIYLPDFKYADGRMAAKFSSGAKSYPEMAKKAMIEMNRQVGPAHPASDGLMYRGLMMRHLVMPNNVGGSKEVVKWIAQNLPTDTYLNIMSQYRPMYKASGYPAISRPITRGEYREVVRCAYDAGLTNLDVQGFSLFRFS